MSRGVKMDDWRGTTFFLVKFLVAATTQTMPTIVSALYYLGIISLEIKEIELQPRLLHIK